ncbi:toxin VasX [Pseudomonas sp. EA_105y_Pfl2_R69]|uniref:toxin VasX n=1 Tax=Pseudomonas sp. EA_105y_Pfl2_R69 TaxID=3088683 RepID=UPI0030DB8E3C
MNQPVNAPTNLKPAACPLLTAVLPVRYAIGPIDPRNPSSLDAATLGLPAITGAFPDLGANHPQLQDQPLGYVPRMLRDGWLYLWEPSLKTLSEYQVKDSLLTPTGRGGAALRHEALAYLMLEAGAPVGLAWSPICWENEQFGAAEQQPNVRQRVFRELIPGAGNDSGQLQALHPQIADVKPENLLWSSAPESRYWLLQEPPLKRMQRCEQQHYALVDDPWGVLFDLAGLLRARNQAFDALSKYRSEEWAIAATIKNISDSDSEIRARIGSILDVARLKATLQEQEREQETLDADRQRIAEMWAQWFATLGGSNSASLETACGHFDITQAAARDALEASFAAACLGPAATSSGVKAIELALDPASTAGKPWLLWALLGVRQRIDPGQLKQLLQVPENLATVTDDVAKAAANFTRVVALTHELNSGAQRLQPLALAASSEPLPAALAPILGGRLPSLSTQIHQHTYTLMLAMLARSQQQMDVMAMTPKQSLLWLSEQMGQSHNKGQRRSLRKRIERLERAEQRSARTSTSQPPAKTPISTATQEQIPHLRLVPKPQTAPVHPQPGYGSEIPPTPNKVSKPAPVLPPIKADAIPDLPRNIADIFDDAPLKTLIAMVAVWNMGVVGSQTWADSSVKNSLSAGSAGFALLTASAAVLQQLADADWTSHVAQAGKVNPEAQKLLANALGAGSAAMFLQSITAGIDVFYYGWQALDSYRAGDLDSAGVYTGLAGANMAYARVSVQAMRAMRIARVAVLAGEGQALATGLRVLTLPLRLSLLGLTATIFLGMVSLFYTQDTPLEQWLKQTRFGIRPADWANSYAGSMRAFYQIVLPVRMSLESWNEQNPRTAAIVEERRLFLRLPGQQVYRQGMLSFDGHEEWQQHSSLFSSNTRCLPLVWGEEDPIPFDPDTGTRIAPEPDGSVRLRRVYHDDGLSTLVRVAGSLTYQPIDGLYLPPIDIDLS